MKVVTQIVLDTVEEMLRIEESCHPDWRRVEALADAMVEYIHSEGAFEDVEGDLYQFLEDYDVRRKNVQYGNGQRGKIRALIASLR